MEAALTKMIFRDILLLLDDEDDDETENDDRRRKNLFPRSIQKNRNCA